MAPQNAATGFRASAADGLALAWREYGSGAALPVICLPGLTRNTADFHELASALAHMPVPRRVLALDYRGRGRSAYDSDWRRYTIGVELNDLLQVLTVAGIEEAIFIGSSRGGLLTMALSAARPGVIRGVVLNDIGPVIEAKGLLRIRGYVGKLPEPRDFREGGEILKRLSSAQFPNLSDREWEGLAQKTWARDETGRLAPQYDRHLMKTLEALDLEVSLPLLWHLFAGLGTVPVLAIRGANSDLLSAETLEAMAKRHPDCTCITVPDQGHTPLLEETESFETIRRFIERVETKETF